MAHRCGSCGEEFGDEVDLKVHQDYCTDEQLFCSQCGERFMEYEATEDGWYYRCPNDGCDGSGLGEDLRPLGAVQIPTP